MRKISALILIAMLVPAMAWAAPLRFEVETGVAYFKWGVAETGLLPLELAPPKWYVDPAFTWSPKPLAVMGVSIVAGFRWQALGREVVGARGWNYIDGPKIGLRGSWALTP